MSHSSDSLPDIALIHVETLPASLFDEFRGIVADDRARLVIDSRKEATYAGLEWLLPTAVVVFITHSYFDGIFKEMGKDHYSLLKAGLKSLWKKLLGPDGPKMIVMSSSGKVRENHPYSLVYSIMADGPAPGLKFKLLFPSDINELEYELTVGAFLVFLKNVRNQTLDSAMAERLRAARVVGSTILLVYDTNEATLRVIDPISR